MLKSLYIKNYAIIDELNIDFNSGFNVFTGETGAGKSIIVGALTYLIKGKADTSVIKSNSDKAIIEGVFSVDNYMKDKLDDAEIEYDDEIIVRRTISRDGRNSIKINQFTVTLSFLIELLSEHIDVHSQKDSQYLLNKKNHLTLLDKYCFNDVLINEYRKLFDEYKIALNEYDELLNNTYNESELEYYKFDLDELLKANISLDEETSLKDKEKRYKSQEKYINVLNNALSVYDDDSGIKERLRLLTKELNIDDNDILNIKDNIGNLYYSLDDEINKLRNILSSFNDEDIDINTIEERLYLYSKLQRKHNCDVNGLLNKITYLKEKISFFENKDTVLKNKKMIVDDLYNKCYLKAKELHEIRTNKAIELENNIVIQTEDLMLNNVIFNVAIKECEININGIDDIEFYISLNKGENLKPLKDIASGGEISRLMLALKTIFTSLSDCSLVIFDEIDTGVSGKVGLSIGRKMKAISKSTQVLAITHLASVAACCDSHYYIYKKDDEFSSNTYIKLLNKDEIIQELANISSTDTSENALAAAKELYDVAQNI